MQIALDTNILVSGLLKHTGNPAQILDLLMNGKLTAVYCSEIVAEYKKVLFRKKFNFDNELLHVVLDTILYAGVEIFPQISTAVFVDESDKIFYDAAVSARALLLTGNTKHFPNERFILAPAEFVKRYGRLMI